MHNTFYITKQYHNQYNTPIHHPHISSPIGHCPLTLGDHSPFVFSRKVCKWNYILCTYFSLLPDAAS
jgi:hypothetical protein